ncbi:MAG: GGDEF domain-containing protein [Gammaproteobacteria bacterium]|nr:MAG: GGDEF domain-containing protein [Gammaproteobacteria bacterium]
MYKLIILVLWLSGLATAAPGLARMDISQPDPARLADVLQVCPESLQKADIRDVLRADTRQAFSPLGAATLAHGIGSSPIWLKIPVSNPTPHPIPRVLVLGVTWTDALEAYVVADTPLEANAIHSFSSAGDLRPFDPTTLKPPDVFLELSLPPGESTIYLRIQGPDPQTLPIALLTPEDAQKRHVTNHYAYGALYGFLLALMAFNLVLYAGLLDRYHVLYALYMAAFTLLNMSYTGHGFMWLWPQNILWQQWAPAVLMVAFAATGLLLALNFLEIRRLAPRVFRYTTLALIIVPACLAGLIAVDARTWGLRLSLVADVAYGVAMLGLSVLALRAALPHARYFLVAVVFGSTGAIITALAVWGLLPFKTLTYRAVDLGMMLEAILLAIAVSARIWDMRARHDRAERLALLDPLTSLFNRRAFYDRSAPDENRRTETRQYAIVMLDIDHFKQFNDDWGHQIGDEVLIRVGQALQAAVRQADVAARWGGEEFILFLRDTDLHHASHLADRLHAAIGKLRIPHEGEELAITVSMGIAQGNHDEGDMDDTIARADKALYQAKANGRNQVMLAA